YKVGTINFEGNILDCFAVDPFNANEYTMGGIDFTGDDDFNDVVNGVPEIMDFGDFFESPNSPPGTFFWRYQLDYEFDPQSQSWAVCLRQNSPEDWNDVFVKYFVGELGFGLMDGLDVGTAFYNAKRNYWAYMQLGGHPAGSPEEAIDYQLLYEFNLYGVPFYRPEILDPPNNASYTFNFTTITDWGFNATFEIQNYTMEYIGNQTLFQIEGAAFTSGTAYPRLPIIIENVTIPSGFTISNISIVWSLSSELPGTYEIPISSEAEEDFKKFYSNYATRLSGNYPGKLFDYTTLTERDGSTTVFLSVFPFQWNADTGKVTYYRNLTLDIDIDDKLENSVSLAVTKQASSKKIGRGSNFLMNIELVNNGSNPVYNILVSEYIEGEFYNNTAISCLSTSGLNDSYLMGFIVKAPLKYFSCWILTQTIVMYQDGAGTIYTLTISSYVYLETWLGIIILILCLIVAIGVTILILKFRH
ncbi:MAG: hypothetical protein ACTSYB_04500, partial [Candidatus Helarchaeota archaeon]